MLKYRPYLFLLFSFFLFSLALNATHNRAGEITYKRIPPFSKVVAGTTVQIYTYSITIVIYTDDTVLSGGSGVADRCQDTVYFGDGTQGVANRVNNLSSVCGCGFVNNKQVGCGEMIVNTGSYKVKQNIYTIEHTYPGTGSYRIRTLDPNRNQGVHNIPNSVNLPFYVESMLIITSFTGANSSPLFAFAPIDQACLNNCFEHNPGAYDPDGDSLSYEITTSKGADGNTVLNYQYPNEGTNGTYEINPVTGLLRWCNPQELGEYNLAFKVKEWRKTTSGNFELIGYVLRDMQVIVRSCNNSPPSITVPNVCVEAGKTVTANLTVKDPDNGSVVKVQGGGGAFEANSPIATFNPQSGITYTSSGSSFNVYFSWQTTCDHIRQQSYYTTFKVEDNGISGIGIKLVSFNTFVIKVVPPAVKNVTATPAGSNMNITWDLSTCSPSANPLVKYKIYRKQDCVPFVPDPCQTGIPASSGFVLIGSTSNSVSEFLDTNNGDGLVVGQDYSYLVVASYSDGTETFGSSQVCARLKRDIPVLLNVDVNTTSKSGEIYVRWLRPITSPNNLDTSNLPKPFRFILKHSSGSKGTFSAIATFTSNNIALLDTQYTHTDFDTESEEHEYAVEFLGGETSVGSSQKASSVFLNTYPSDRKITLNWKSKTPWKNTLYSVMRQDSTSPNFVLIGTTSLTAYTDKNNVVNGSNYCYYIISEGQYSDPNIFAPLINKSQISCARAKDTIPPVTPTISIDADCPLGTVEVSWGDISTIEGSDDVLKYELYYKPLVDGVYTRIAEVLRNQPLYFKQDDPNSFSGCYSVRATDIHDNVGPFSPDFCIDNCPEFELPNVFSPNDDGINDHFKAIIVKQIKEINLSVVDRWGNVLYTTKDPYFKWDGVSAVSKAPVSEGTFFYVCDVFEPRLKGIVKRTLKGTVQVVR
jgi:gliding motility-associated-like protein